ncbi:MAG: DUF1732 domain-containing protein [Deltaproteobacteria bacterium]|nr:DUF1732 domain-containing protein [Deltaproteobacteria bacterium]
MQAVDLRELVVVEEPTVRYERFWRQVHTIVRRALQQLERMRRTEGAHLQRDQRRRLSRLESLVGRIARLAGAIQLADRRERAAWGNGGAGGSTEGTSYGMPAERAAIHEEITRLQSHLRQYRQYAARPGPVGRQLDFLLQEMNREINTIGSKGNDANISHLVVEAKSELEKLREQVQNIE